MRTKTLAERAHEIQTTGLTGAYEKAFRDLEEKLAQAQGIVNTRNATATAVATLMELIEDLRYDCDIKIFPCENIHLKSFFSETLEISIQIMLLDSVFFSIEFKQIHSVCP